MPKNKYGLIAELVWDGGPQISIPAEMGTPADNQMQGTVGERLAELAGRICYDSLGRGRSSPDYHQHILQVGHTSVLAHFHRTVELNCEVDVTQLLNRPGLWVLPKGPAWRVTFNPRALVDWNMWSKLMRSPDVIGEHGIGDILAFHAERELPMILRPLQRAASQTEYYERWTRVVEPEDDEEKWVSLMLSGSRGFSHEQVRHAFRCGISQRSTRYVDENESPWIDHPLLQEYFLDVKEEEASDLKANLASVRSLAREAYGAVTTLIQGWLNKRGVDKLTARKQARGAARGYLGNALQTEMIFSASVGQWKRMLRMRCNGAADAEIRLLYNVVLPELQKSRYFESFSGFELIPSPDGFGCVAEEN